MAKCLNKTDDLSDEASAAVSPTKYVLKPGNECPIDSRHMWCFDENSRCHTPGNHESVMRRVLGKIFLNISKSDICRVLGKISLNSSMPDRSLKKCSSN